MLNVTADEMNKFRAMFGNRANQTLNIILKSIEHLNDAFASPVARAVMDEDLDRERSLMEKAYQENLSDDERIELRYINKRLNSIARHFQNIEKREREIIESLKKVKE